MAKLTLTNLISTYESIVIINNNNDLIETALENTLSRDGTIPNEMNANLDMNSNRILNLTDGQADGDPVTVRQLNAYASADLGSASASAVTIIDSGGHYDAVNVEGALQEVFDDLGANTTGEGASRIGIEDSAGEITATTVEGALAEIAVTATTTQRGLVEIATSAEIDAGTADKIVDAAGLAASANYGYETGTFTANWEGFTTSPSTVWDYTKLGNIVLLSPQNSIDAISNSGLFRSGATEVPASIRPTAFRRMLYNVKNNAINQMGYLQITTGGRLEFYANLDGSAFTSSNNKGFALLGLTVAYLLD